MSGRRACLAWVVVLAAALPAGAGTTTFTETFDGGSNVGGWTWGFGDTIEAMGGNPGAYLHTAGLDTFAPRPHTTTGGPFIGDYRAKGVTGIGVDLVTFHVDFSADERPLTLMLIHDNATPGDPFDDTAAYFMGPNIPLPGEGWLSYDFAVPAASTTLPAGWQLLNLGDSGSPAAHTWDQVVQSVSEVAFFYGDPTLFFIFQQWVLGLDNPRITTDTQGGGDPPGNRVTICHRPPGNPDGARTITVNRNALPAHLAHGDSIGACPDGSGGSSPRGPRASSSDLRRN